MSEGYSGNKLPNWVVPGSENETAEAAPWEPNEQELDHMRGSWGMPNASVADLKVEWRTSRHREELPYGKENGLVQDSLPGHKITAEQMDQWAAR